MTEALWQNNQFDVYDIRTPDYGEITLRLDGPASSYLEEALRQPVTAPEGRAGGSSSG
jgi:hypothetical protein